MLNTLTTTPKNPLPTGILPIDLERPAFDAKGANAFVDDYQNRDFYLWYVKGFGWCIPTLAISNKGQRTYAVRISDRQCVRIGMGPHVIEQTRVYVRKNRLNTLQMFLSMREDGAGRAGQIRDRISSRRAQGAEMRAQGRTSWRWTV